MLQKVGSIVFDSGEYSFPTPKDMLSVNQTYAPPYQGYINRFVNLKLLKFV